MRPRRAIRVALGSLLAAGSILAVEPVANWSAPSQWSAPRARGAKQTMDITPSLPFVGLTPCRIADTRAGSGFSTGYGPPSLAAGAPRPFFLAGTCGIPSAAGAISLNVTVTNTTGPGFILIYPFGSGQPTVSTLNYVAGQTIANAAVVPLGGGGITVVAGVSGTDLILDTNGYYGGPSLNTFTIVETNNGSPGPALLVQNLSTSCTFDCGIEGTTASTNHGYGVSGRALGTSGVNYGVFGRNNSSANDGAGVFGLDKSGPGTTSSYNSAGVRGESLLGFGVLGIANGALLNGGAGVGGSALNNSGVEVAYGVLAAPISVHEYGVFAGGDIGGTGAKSFIDPHPTDASKVIRYVALEGPESGTYFRGRGRFQGGMATIDVPEDFRLVTDPDGLSVQITPIGDLATVAVLQVGLDGIVVKSSRNVEFFYTVNGVRHSHKDLTPIGLGGEFMPHGPNTKMPAYLTDVQKAILISNGTYREDGTVNLDTAKRLGWDRIWEARQGPAQAQKSAEDPR